MRCFARGKTTGVEEYARQLLLRVFEQDKENEYILFSNAYKGNDVDLSWATRYDNVTLKSFRYPNKILNALLWYARWPKIDTLIGGVDVFFMPNINFVAVSKKARLVVTIHDLSFEHHKETFSWKRRLWHGFVHPRDLCKRANAIMAVSVATARDLVKTYHLPPEKIHTTLSALTLPSRTVSRNDSHVFDVRAHYALPRRFFLYFGTLEPRKNVAGIIRAYTLYRDKAGEGAPSLVLAGAPGWKTHIILQALAASPYRDDIRVLENIPTDHKDALYILAECFLYPSFFEGFGFPPLEAFAVGTPVVTSHTSSLPEVVGRYATMVDPWRTEELVVAMREAAYDTNKKREASAPLLQRHARTFSWDPTAKLFHSIAQGEHVSAAVR